mgnify:CR=1 FL=1
MKRNENFSDFLQRNKKVVFILMVAILFIGCGKWVYDRFFVDNTEFGTTEKMEVLEDRIKTQKNRPGVSPMEFMDIYEDINNLQDLDTLQIRELNEKLDKMIENEN